MPAQHCDGGSVMDHRDWSKVISGARESWRKLFLTRVKRVLGCLSKVT